MHFNSATKNKDLTQVVKLSLRDVGHQLLLSNNDSTSLVLPVKALNKKNYKLSFANKLSFEPSNLVTIIQQRFEKVSLPKHYRVEVIQCVDKEVAYSYEMKYNKENAIIPCRGRILPNNCYTIELNFIDKTSSLFSLKTFFYLLLSVIFILFIIDYNKTKQIKDKLNNSNDLIAIGSFWFNSEQNMLLKGDLEISLSKKERELLEIFVSKPNQIIKREELMKKVWEDNGVIVGRSLDTYISKLRKKLIADDTIKLSNVHGVGYKLEIG